MSGHSHASNVMHKKLKMAAVKGRVFTKIGREIAVAVKSGGSDPASNSRLYDAVAKAKAANMPNDNIARSIKKAAGELGSINYESITYEGYAAGGAAVIVETLTDNKNRTAGDVRHIFDKYGGSLGGSGCVSYMFARKGLIAAERGALSEDDILNLALEAGADDCEIYGDGYELIAAPQNFRKVSEYLESKKITPVSAELALIPDNTVTAEPAVREKIELLIEKLEELDDVQNVYCNLEE